MEIACPFCQSPVPEAAHQCPTCFLSLPKLERLLGIPPVLARGVTDLTRQHHRKELSKIRRIIANFEVLQPESQLNVIFNNFDQNYPLQAQLFWLFNSPSLGRRHIQKENNRDLLIGIDTEAGSAGIVIGFGLEPFLSPERLHPILNSALPSFEQGGYTDAIAILAVGLDELISSIAKNIAEAPVTLRQSQVATY